jgi:hypothetical protein
MHRIAVGVPAPFVPCAAGAHDELSGRRQPSFKARGDFETLFAVNVIGYGHDKPLTAATRRAGRAQNRRVVTKVLV